MTSKPTNTKASADKILKYTCQATRPHFSAEDKMCILLDGLRGEDSVAELAFRDGVVQNNFNVWSEEFVGIARALAGDTFQADGSDRFPLPVVTPACRMIGSDRAVTK